MKSLKQLEGIKVDEKGKSLPTIENALELVRSISKQDRDANLSAALSSSLLTANSLIQSSSAKCTLDTPPEDIDVKVDSSGNLILRCYHFPAHEWDLSGNSK